MKKLFTIFCFGLNDQLEAYDDGYLASKNIVTLMARDGDNAVRISVSVEKLIDNLTNLNR